MRNILNQYISIFSNDHYFVLRILYLLLEYIPTLLVLLKIAINRRLGFLRIYKRERTRTVRSFIYVYG